MYHPIIDEDGIFSDPGGRQVDLRRKGFRVRTFEPRVLTPL